MQNCISFCELLHMFTGDVKRDSETLIVAKNYAKFDKIDRLYLGSNFCSRYFLKYALSAFDCVAKTLKDECGSPKVTLCVPVFSQLYLEDGKKLITLILQTYSDIIDEITVNDIGMLEFALQFNNVLINVGRMMNKDARDVRYDAHFNLSHKPETFTLTNSVLKNYKINNYEFDVTNKYLDFLGVSESFSIYYPYVFATVGNICEYAGVSLPIEKKFRSNYTCAYDCVKFLNRYHNEFNDEYIKLGKASYFKVNDFVIKADKPYRMVFEPFDAFKLKGDENE
ncbi:MAG: hypothetical protein J6Q58_03765 [Clostridia bacterium]|nr:hypothetical protein [Clostridia bacterium]